MAGVRAAAVLVVLGACVHRARIVTDVPGAEVRLAGKPVGVTPVEVVKSVHFEPPAARSKGIMVKDTQELVAALRSKGLV